jgi:hypothetical protein
VKIFNQTGWRFVTSGGGEIDFGLSKFLYVAGEAGAFYIRKDGESEVVTLMPKNQIEGAVVAVVAAACAATWGYAIPSYLSVDRRWQLLALPAGLLAGAIAWTRYGSRPRAPGLALEVSMAERLAVTAGAIIIGAAGGVFIPLGLTRSFPRWIVAVPLGMLLALVLGLIAWNNPALFFKDRSF